MTPARTTAVLLLTVALVFGQTLRFGFVWDDLSLLAANEHLVGPGAIANALTADFWDSSVRAYAGSGYWRPLVKLSHVALRAVGGGAAWPFHLFNVALHMVCTLLVAAWVRRRVAGAPELAALVAGLLFALHPSRFEVVPWASASTELLFGALALTAVLAFEGNARWGLLALAAAAACKETAVVVPVLMAGDAWLRGELRLKARWLGGAAGAVLVVYAARALTHVPFWGGGAPGPLAIAAPRVLGAFAAFHQRTLWPAEVTVSAWDIPRFDTGHFYLSPGVWGAGALLASGWLAFGVVALLKPSLRPWLADALWWVLPLGPVLQVFPLPTPLLVADRFLYLPLAGVGVLAARGLTRLGSAGRAVAGLTVGLAAVWAALMTVALPAFIDNASFFRREFSLHPRGPFVAESWARLLQDGRHFRAEQRVLERLMPLPMPASRRVSLLSMLAAARAMTLRDQEVEALTETSRFFDALLADQPATLMVNARAEQVPGGAAAGLLKSADAKWLREVQVRLHARLGRREGWVALLEARRRQQPSPATSLALAGQLALSGRRDELAAVLNADAAAFEGARELPSLQTLLTSPPAADDVPGTLAYARALAAVGSPAMARQRVAPLLAAHADEPEVVDTRVVVELADGDFDAALALIEAALAAKPQDPGWLAAREEVRAGHRAWRTRVNAELELAEPF